MINPSIKRRIIFQLSIFIICILLINCTVVFGQDNIVKFNNEDIMERIFEEGIDNNMDGKISFSEAKSVKTLEINNLCGEESSIDFETKIDDLKYFTELESLSLQRNAIKDISPLANLSSLQELSLSDNNIVDISALENLIKLESLGLSNNRISNLEPIANLIKIKYLDLGGNNYYESIFPLINMKQLNVLTLSSKELNSIEGVEKFVLLEKLLIIDTDVADFSFIQELNNLKWLEIEDNNNNISDFSFISKLKNVSWLVLKNVNLTDIDFLSDLTELGILSLNDNNITNIEPLSNLTGLYELYLRNNDISDVGPLSGMKQLNTLFLSNNSIYDTNPLGNLKDIRQLNIEGNPIKDICFGNSLNNLNILEISNTGIRSLEGIETFVDLGRLDIERNYLETDDLEILLDLDETFTLFIYANNIDYREIEKEDGIIEKLENKGYAFYPSKKVTQRPIILLKCGDIELEYGEEYIDPGGEVIYKNWRDEEEIITWDNVSISGDIVDNSIPGEYIINYNIDSSLSHNHIEIEEKTRLVTVKEKVNIKNNNQYLFIVIIVSIIIAVIIFVRCIFKRKEKLAN